MKQWGVPLPASVLAALCGVAAVSAEPVLAQTASTTSAGSAGDDLEEIVVTGTLIRGVAPVGTSVQEVKREDIIASGATNSVDLLALVPQSASFATTPRSGSDLGNPVNSVQLRNPGGVGGGASTLTLLNGHRMVGVGVIQTVIDPSVVPATLLDHVDMVLDGGSSIYGADAVGGVVNFVTRKRFDGIDAGIRYETASPYHGVNVDVTAGRDWGTGSASIAFNEAYHNNIQGKDRDYITDNLSAKFGPSADKRVSLCAPGNVVAGGVTYALPGLAANTTNLCDPTDYTDSYPTERRYNVFGSLTQTIAPGVELDIDGFYSQRRTSSHLAPFTGNLTIDNTNPYFKPIAGETSQGVEFDYTPAFGVPVGTTRIDSEGFTPSLTFKLRGDWQVKFDLNYGRSENVLHNPKINTSAASAAIAGTTLATALNPYDLSATNAAVLALIGDYEQQSGSTQVILDEGVVADGTLFDIPGGPVKGAFGAEHRYDSDDAYSGFHASGAAGSVLATNVSRSDIALFGDVVLPIVDAPNAMPGIRSLQLEVSARYDHYSDFGSTTNPKIGISYKPFSSLTFRGSYGTSFTAPSFGDTAAVDSRYVFFPPFLFKPGVFPNFATQVDVLLAGGNPQLQAQKAKIFSYGVNFQPEFVKGLQVDLNMYDIDFKDLVSLPAFTSGLFTNASLSSYYVLAPTEAQLAALTQGYVLDGVNSISDLYANGHSVYAWIDARRTNLARTRSRGLDLNLSYNLQTSFGSLFFRGGGTYALSRKTTVAPGSPDQDDLQYGISRLQAQVSAGANVGALMSSLTLNHLGGYDANNLQGQPHVSSYDVLNFALGYKFGSTSGFAKDLSLQFNIDNLLDRDPPVANNGNGGYANGSTLGRLFSVGIRKKL